MQSVLCTFMGRAVEVRVVSFGTLMEANDVAGKSGRVQDASWYTLAKSAYWQDTGEPVFTGIQGVLGTPATHAGELMRMSRHCMELNKPDLGEDDAKAKGNGHDSAVAGPSL